MSKLEAQIAEAEAGESPDGEGEGEGEGEPIAGPDDDEAGEAEDADEGAAEAEQLPESTVAMIRKLEGEHTRHRKALASIMGEGFSGYDDCPVCNSMGYVAGTPLKQDSKVQTCEHCAGFGQVLTGAIAPGEAVRQCPNCLGLGHVPTSTPDAPAFIFTTTAGNGTTTTPAPDPEIERLTKLGYTVLPPLPVPAAS